MNKVYHRRQAIKWGVGALAGLSVLGLAGCDSSSITNTAAATSGTMHMLFWGSATREQITKTTFDLFHKQNPTFAITSEVYGFDVYWKKLNALIDGGKIPDLIQMDMRYVAQYVRQRRLLDLTEIIYNQGIDLSDFDPLLLSSSKVNNTVYGIPLGGNYQSAFYDKESVTKSTVGDPPANMSWDDFANYTTELTKGLGGSVYGTMDASGEITNFEIWIRERGKELYTRDGHINFSQNDVGDWYEYWNKLRDRQGCLPFNIQKGLDVAGTPENSSMIKGKSVFLVTLSNLFEAYQKGALAASPTRQLGMIEPPTGGPGSSPGLYLKPSLLLSISATTKYTQAAINYANFLINDVSAVKTLGIERGIPGSTKAKNLLNPQLTSTQQTIADYVSRLSNSENKTRVKIILDPPGAGQIAELLRSVSYDIAGKKVSVSEGAQSFYTQAKKIVGG
ncbi:ABC transporter substrate-binding protein [Ktedonospora formicarum]|uniref:Sugar ABC transporter substrate-binding protein n=1 Tax=Ktedonospora formicarum TaxID=2778364 RepID=A0A8J3IDZ0_9CHLR|nr:ABC transporter substrate-binding protein [Ktedonospora formicarum]GHO51007.1 sugar ABC transporter substrate-binding protein [Ktedonospora formicarum]